MDATNNSKCKVIAICNQKGGVAKTTTAQHLGVSLAKLGKKVLLIDSDPQGSLTRSFGHLENEKMPNTLTSVFQAIIEGKNIDPDYAILKDNEGVDLMPSNLSLSVMENDMSKLINHHFIMKTYICLVRDNYDYILIDCPPSMNALSKNALTAADSVLIPTLAETSAIDGLNNLIESILRAKKTTNPSLKFEGVLFTNVTKRAKNAETRVKDIQKEYGEHIRVFDFVIPYSDHYSEASSFRVSVFSYSKKSKAGRAYRQLAKEVI